MSRKAILGLALTWALWTAIVAPLTVVAHEAGHAVAGLALGAPDVVLHFASTSDRAEVLPAWRAAAIALAGPAVSLALTGVGFAWATLRGPHPPALALAATAPIRFLASGLFLVFLARAGLTGSPLGTPDFDEANAARLLGVPVGPLLVLEVALLFLIWGWTVARFPRGLRLVLLAAMVVGAGAGLALWMSWVGPWLLP